MDKLTNNNHDDESIDTEQVYNSDQLPRKLNENPNHEFNKKIKKTLFIKLGAAAAGLLVAGGAWLGISAANDTPKSEPAAEAPADPSTPVAPVETITPAAPISPETVKLDVTKIPEDVIEYNLFEKLSAEEQAEILEMKAMEVPEFRLLPHPQQLKFAYFVYDNNIDVLKYRLDQTGQADIYKGANFETANGMRNNDDLKYLLLASLKTMSPEDGIAIDTDTALKASVYLNPDGNENRQINADNQIMSWNLNTPAVAGETTITDSATLPNGDIVSNEFGPATQSSAQNTYRVIDVPLINGETRKDGVMVLSVSESDVRYIHDIHNR